MSGVDTVNGPDDGGVMAAAFQLALKLDDARAAHVEANPPDDGLSPVLRALLDASGPAVEEGPPGAA